MCSHELFILNVNVEERKVLLSLILHSAGPGYFFTSGRLGRDRDWICNYLCN